MVFCIYEAPEKSTVQLYFINWITGAKVSDTRTTVVMRNSLREILSLIAAAGD